MFIKKSPWRFVGYSSGQFAGAYASKFHSNGLEFSQVQPYVSGESVTSIDWKTSAKKSQLYVKHFTPERALDVYFCVDVSSSCAKDFFGEKKQLQFQLVELLAQAVGQNHDRANIVLYDTEVVYVHEKITPHHILPQIEHQINAKTSLEGEQKNIDACVDYMIQKNLKNKVIFFFTDQYENFDKKLFALAKQNTLVIFGCFHRCEIDGFDISGWAKFRTHQGNMYLGMSGNEDKKNYQESVKNTLRETQRTLLSHKIHFTYFSTSDNIVQKLWTFLQQKF